MRQNWTQDDAVQPGTFVPAIRLQQSWTAAIEKHALIWIAERTPGWINSDHVTILGFVAQCAAGVCYALSGGHPAALLWGVVCLVLNWLGDSLDGTLARVRSCQRPRYGFYVDHIADSVSALFLMGGLALSGFVRPAIAVGLLVSFLVLSIESYLATYTVGKFHISHWKFGPTELRLLLAAGNLAVFHNPAVTVFGTHWRLFDFGGCIGIGGMTLMFVMAGARHITQLYREETIEVPTTRCGGRVTSESPARAAVGGSAAQMERR
jgi:phosphatidylglycerophosphate synthase